MLNIINVKKDIKRRNKIIEKCNKFNIKYKIHYGVDGSKYNFSYKEKYLLRKLNLKKKKGDACCLLSHIYLLEKLIRTTKQKKFLICEDDCNILDPEFNKYIYYLIKNINYNILHLANVDVNKNKGKKHLKKIGKYNLFTSKGYNGQGAMMYIISRTQALHMLNLFYKGLIDKPIDLKYFDSIPNNILIYPPLATDNNFKSTRKLINKK